MKKLFTGLLMVLSFSAIAEPTVAASVEDAKVIVASKCVEGCLILSAEDVAELSAQIDMAMEQAYQAGLSESGKKVSF